MHPDSIPTTLSTIRDAQPALNACLGIPASRPRSNISPNVDLGFPMPCCRSVCSDYAHRFVRGLLEAVLVDSLLA